MVIMIALHRGCCKGVANWYNAGIGSLFGSRSFNLLPITLLPRLSVILPAFFTVGCAFEGDQSTLANSWFVIYPAVVEIVLIVTSLIDILARAYHRRINSTVVSVTIMLLSLLHAMRLAMIR